MWQTSSTFRGALMRLRSTLPFLAVLASIGVFASWSLRAQAPQTNSSAPGNSSAEPMAIWNALSRPTFDPAKVASVKDLAIEHDRIRITLESGVLHFAQPVNGIVTAAVFHGKGRLQVSAPNERESQRLQYFLKTDGLNLTFSEATLSFTDKTFEEISSKVVFAPAASPGDELYAERMGQLTDLGFGVLPQLFKSVMAADRTKNAQFFADLKTDDKGWVETQFDTTDPEEITVGRFQTVASGYRGFDEWLRFPAGGRSSASAYDDPFAKDDYVIRSYSMDAAVTSGAELSATTKVNFDVKLPGERVLVFGLDSNLRVDKVANDKGAALAFIEAREQKDRVQSYGNYVAVVLPAPTQGNESASLTFHYTGRRVVKQEGAGVYFAESFGWYPTQIKDEAFASRADFDIRFHSPKKFTLVATGNKVNETTDGKDVITEWRTDVPLAVAGFAFGDYKLSVEKVGNVDVQVFANRNNDDSMQFLQQLADGGLPGVRAPEVAVGNLSPAAMAPTISAEMGNALRLFQKYYGPYPYKQLAVTNIPYSYGQGWPGLIYLSIVTFLDDQQRHSFGIPDTPRSTEFFRAHETSHQWWGHRVGWKSYHDQWMSEGFAQFSGNLYVQFRDNMKQYEQRLRDDRQGLLTRDQHNDVYDSVGPVWMGQRVSSSLSPGAYSVIIYNKGGYVLTMLRMMLRDTRQGATIDPDARFEAMMQDFCKTYENKPASTEDFKAIVEKHMLSNMDLEGNHKMDWFFRQYVYGTGIPRYEFHVSTSDAGGGQTKMTGTLTRSGVPDNWMDVIPVFGEKDGKPNPIGFFRATRPESPVNVTLPFNPGKVTINSYEELLAEVKQ
jgi:hypothetical protein